MLIFPDSAADGLPKLAKVSEGIDRCCTHVIRPDGKLDSFCRYYSGFTDCTH
ncbi:MAG: hypothetical protein HY301_05560 [Verrucomicrobia bacterium]|nr:hypothetical protein [Verrucomicrobiota bacterium]